MDLLKIAQIGAITLVAAASLTACQRRDETTTGAAGTTSGSTAGTSTSGTTGGTAGTTGGAAGTTSSGTGTSMGTPSADAAASAASR
jgi:hypothetical protein